MHRWSASDAREDQRRGTFVQEGLRRRLLGNPLHHPLRASSGDRHGHGRYVGHNACYGFSCEAFKRKSNTGVHGFIRYMYVVHVAPRTSHVNQYLYSGSTIFLISLIIITHARVRYCNSNMIVHCTNRGRHQLYGFLLLILDVMGYCLRPWLTLFLF